MLGRIRIFGLLLACLTAQAEAAPRLLETKEAPPLRAWRAMCREMPAECAVDPKQAATIAGAPETRDLIEAVNRYVNRSVQPITDMAYRGVADRWELPSEGKGDCEDFQLLKRKLLVEAGLSRRALLMTVVINRQGEGHAVLTVRLDDQDLILDNQTDAVLPWDQTGLTFIKREAETKTGWVFVAPEPEMEPEPKVMTAAAE